MQQGFAGHHFISETGPSGGRSFGVGFTIAWQNGPLGRGAARRSPNGAFVEDVLGACMDRLEFYETACDGQFSCAENQVAIYHLKEVLRQLNNRTQRREEAGTEGTHEGD